MLRRCCPGCCLTALSRCRRDRFMDDTTNVAHFCMTPPHGALSCTGPWTFTAADQLDFSQATFEHLEQALSSLDVKGKTAIVSTAVGAAPAVPAPLNSSAINAMLLRRIDRTHCKPRRVYVVLAIGDPRLPHV